MRILICNDDGVFAPGITVLAHTLRSFADVTVVAPQTERSTTGHTLTLDHPLRVVEVSPQTFGCSGYPADCALLGVAHLMKANKPDLVISGINKGANLGQDIFYSGTVAAAREAAFHNVPSISVSSAMNFAHPNPPEDFYQTAADFIAVLVKAHIWQEFIPREVLNINVPDLAEADIRGVAVTTPGFRHYSEEVSERTDFKGRSYYWIGGVYSGFEKRAGTDCQVVDEAMISVSSLNVLGASPDRNEKWREFFKTIPGWGTRS